MTTELEQKVIDSIQRDGHNYDGYTCNCIQNLSDILHLSTKILRGVVSSLIQKGKISEIDLPSGITAYCVN